MFMYNTNVIYNMESKYNEWFGLYDHDDDEFILNAFTQTNKCYD